MMWVCVCVCELVIYSLYSLVGLDLRKWLDVLPSY